MFSKNKSEPVNQPNGTGVRPAVPSIISADLVVRGDLISDGEIQIDGTIHGDINTATLLVGETAEVNGEIKAKRVRVHGRVNGQVMAESVTLAKTAHVSGDVVHEDLSIEKGAFLEGHCKRISEQKPEHAPAKRAEGDTVKPPVPSKPIHSDGVSTVKKMEKPSNGADKAASA